MALQNSADESEKIKVASKVQAKLMGEMTGLIKESDDKAREAEELVSGGEYNSHARDVTQRLAYDGMCTHVLRACAGKGEGSCTPHADYRSASCCSAHGPCSVS